MDVVNDNRVWCSVETTINLGNYENIKLQVGESRTITPEDDADEIKNELLMKLTDDLKEYKDEVKKVWTNY